MGAKKINHTENLGKKFGRLTIVEIVPKGKYYYYNCICDCGNGASVTSFTILKGQQISCGCFQKEQVAKSRKGIPNKSRKINGEPSFRYLWHTYNRNAKKRNVQFNLTYEEFKQLTKGICYYCGQEPNRIVKHFLYNRNKKLYNYDNPYYHNGVDRVDNNIGYTKENSVSCCRTCNIAKGTQTKEEFMNWIQKVYKFNYDKS